MYKLLRLSFFALFVWVGFLTSWAGTDDFPSKAKWISNGSPVLTDEESMYANHAAPLFRKQFSVDAKKVSKATLYIAAAGYYRASLNGERIGDAYLDPAWTDFGKRIYYARYDLSNELRDGDNCLGISIGNGFYNPLPLKMWGYLNLRNALLAGNPSVIACLKIEYSDGSTTEITTDPLWKFSDGPILKDNVYLGEWYDARCEKSGWDLPGFDDTGWSFACNSSGPGGELLPRFFQPVKITAQINLVKIFNPSDGIYVVDMGTDFSGIYKIKLKGNQGDTITFRFGERLYANRSLNPMTTVCGQIKKKGQGGPGSPDIAWQTDVYVFGKNNEVWYSPEFTFHTFRYMEIKGLKYLPETSDISGLALNSAVEECNHFECSSDLLNAIQKMCVRTFKSNIVSVESDCPARERFGYGGDINAVAGAYISNFDMHDFYRKAVYDWADALNDSVFIDTAPYVGLKYCGISWESAFLFLQDDLYRYYGDSAIVHEMYARDLTWMGKVARLHPEMIVKKGLGDHESMIPVPVQVTGTCHYLQAAGVMKNFARLMNDPANEKKFASLESDIRKKLLDTFWKHPSGDIEKLNKQTLYAALLYSDVIPENEKQAVVDSLRASVIRGANSHFTTGIFGTRFILEALSHAGFSQQVFDIVNSTAFPGWGYMIDHGATTIWETWKESDDTYSNCHPMFGSVSEWFYRWLGGIQQDANSAGFKKICIKPQTPDGLTYVKTSYKTPCGYVRSDWEKTPSNEMVYTITVPQGTVAVFEIPAGGNIWILHGTEKISLGDQDFTNGFLKKELSAGEYVITKR
jgi:alpha-L-rhamnosidase